jgi:hypothetical protein
MLKKCVDSLAIRIAIACCFALAIVPRTTVYEHEHAGETPGHVHAWDGARLDSVRELIDEARGGRDHAHPHVHDGDDHPHGDAAEHAKRVASRKVETRGPAYASTAHSGARHAHAQAPFQSVARATAAPLSFARLQTPVVVAAATQPRSVACPAPSARAPPLSVQA